MSTPAPTEPAAALAPEAGAYPEPPEPDCSPGPEDSPAKSRPKLTLRSPSEIVALEFNDDDIILGDRLLALGQSLVLAGQGGLGKSRLLRQFAAAVVARRKFLAFETGGSGLRWLILQSQDTNRRLKYDLEHLRAWLGEGDWGRFDAQVVFHTLENDTDGFVSLDSPANQAAIAAAIADSRADVIGIDPLDEFGMGDLSKDADMRETLTRLSRLCRQGNSQRAPVLCHHALTGHAGAVKATGYDRASFARNSKVLLAWARAQINLAPVDEDNYDRLIVACGKCSNGKEFEPFAIRLNPETMIYECDPTVSVREWAVRVAAKNPPKPTPAMEDFIGLFRESEKPRECLLSAEQLRDQFRRRNWDKNAVPALRDEAEGAGKLAVWHGPHNAKLCGLPQMVAAWRQQQTEKDTLLAQVPLPAKLNTKPKTKHKKCRK